LRCTFLYTLFVYSSSFISYSPRSSITNFTMLSRQVLLAILAALSVSAVPLNINLGAYSPALVVGDGEISFGGNPEQASTLLQTLASGAANGAVGNGQQAPRPLAGAPAPEGQRPAGQAPAPIAAAPAGEGITSPLVTPTLSEQASPKPDTNIAAPAIVAEGMGSSMPAEYISHAVSGTKYPNMAKTKSKRSIEVRNPEADARVEVAKQKIRRDIDGFREALAFARDAQRNSPKVELGFGITQSPGINVPANSAANGALPPGGVARPEKRDVSSSTEKLGMTLIAISEI
jgi:hypothetical protein